MFVPFGHKWFLDPFQPKMTHSHVKWWVKWTINVNKQKKIVFLKVGYCTPKALMFANPWKLKKKQIKVCNTLLIVIYPFVFISYIFKKQNKVVKIAENV